MADILIRDVPDDVISAIDANASRTGLSRAEYLRRRLAQETVAPDVEVTVEDLRRMGEVFADARDPEIMKGAWHRPHG